jgi:hypothetical protein
MSQQSSFTGKMQRGDNCAAPSCIDIVTLTPSRYLGTYVAIVYQTWRRTSVFVSASFPINTCRDGWGRAYDYLEFMPSEKGSPWLLCLFDQAETFRGLNWEL